MENPQHEGSMRKCSQHMLVTRFIFQCCVSMNTWFLEQWGIWASKLHKEQSVVQRGDWRIFLSLCWCPFEITQYILKRQTTNHPIGVWNHTIIFRNTQTSRRNRPRVSKWSALRHWARSRQSLSSGSPPWSTLYSQYCCLAMVRRTLY